jgi:hypothetical protein
VKNVVMRRNLLCFVTGAVVTLAVVLLVRSGNDRPQPSAASTPPAATTAAGEPTPNVKLRGHHASPHGHRGASTTAGASAPSAGGATTSHAAATPASKPSKPRGTDTTPTVPQDDTPTVPDDGTTPPTDTGTTPPAGDDGSGASATPNTDPPVTIPNQSTPDSSVGGP